MVVKRWYLESFSEVSEKRAGCLSLFFSVPGVILDDSALHGEFTLH